MTRRSFPTGDALRRHSDNPALLHAVLIECIRERNHTGLHQLLGSGVDVTLRDSHSLTALHHAVLNENEEATLALIAHGADPNARDPNGASPLHYSALKGFASMVPILVNHGADPNAVDTDGRTALHWVGIQGHAATAEALVNAGAADPVSREDKFGATAVDYALTSYRPWGGFAGDYGETAAGMRKSSLAKKVTQARRLGR